MRCFKCQHHNREGAKFCHSCGDKLEERCPRCDRMISPGAKFCDECGFCLTQSSDASLIDFSRPASYTPKFLADKIMISRERMEGERKWVTALSADVANYTSISEKLDPEQVHRIMDECLRLLVNEIHAYEGTIVQFTGDGMLALFGAPLAHEDHARRACYSALSIQKTLKRYGERIRRDYSIEFKMRMGIHSGLVLVGSIGDDLHMDYTAIGDTLHLTSTLQALADRGATLVSRDTYRMARDYFHFRSMGEITVPGKEEALEAYELVKVGAVDTRIRAALMRGLNKFVGRGQEIDSLIKAFEKTRSGMGQVVGVVGEAGVGKSRLILEFKKGLRETESTFIKGECFHFGAAIAYAPILDMLRSYFDLKEGMPEWEAKKKMEEGIQGLDKTLRHLLPPLHDLLSLTVEDETYLKFEPKLKREKIFEAIKDLFVTESQKRPLVLVMEDLHWIDKTSEEFITYFINSLAGARILLILLYRLEYSHSWGNRSNYAKIGLDQLQVLACSELLNSLLEGEKISMDLQDLIIHRTGGNPLFIEELTYSLLESGSIEKTGRGYALKGEGREIQAPDTLQGIIAARMDRLDEPLKRILQLASVIGKDFTYPILGRITGMGEELKPYLFRLQELEFFHVKSLFPELEYTFKHALMHEIAYNNLLIRKRREIHERIGEATESLYPERIEEFFEILAHHYSRSENRQKAFKYLKLSGMKAIQNSSLWEAFRLFQAALQGLSKLAQTDEVKRDQIELRLHLASPMISLGFPENSLQLLKEGERLSKEVGDTKSYITFHSITGLCYSVRGDPLTGVTYGEECLKAAEEAKDVGLIAPIAFDLCSNYGARGDFIKVVRLAPRILSLLERAGKIGESFDRGYNIYSALSALCGFCEGYMGRFEKGIGLCTKAIQVAAEIKNLYSLGLAEILSGYIYCTKGEGKEALGHFEKSIQYLENGQIFVLLGLAWSGIGWAHYYMGDLQTARTFMERGLKLQQEAGVTYDFSVHFWFLATVHCDLGELEKAREYAEEAVRLSHKNDEMYVEGISKVILGRILTRSGNWRSAGAEKSMLQGIQILKRLKIRTLSALGYLCLAELYFISNRRVRALKPFYLSQWTFWRTGMDYWLDRTQASLKEVRS